MKRSNRTRRPSTWNAWYWDVPLAALTLALAVWLLQANQPLFWAGHQLAAHGHATLWAYVTLCGDTLMVLTLCLPLVRVRPELIWAGVLAGVLAAVAVQGLKHGLLVMRPSHVFPAGQLHLIGNPLRSSAAFPSGHAATIFTMIGVVMLWMPAAARRYWAPLLLALALLVSLSRIVVGAHWPLDVLAGAAIGWLAAVLGSLWARRWRWGETAAGRTTLTLLLTACALTALVHYHSGYPQTDPGRRIIALLALGLAGYQFCVARWGAAAEQR